MQAAIPNDDRTMLDSQGPRAGASSVSDAEKIPALATRLTTEGGLESSEGVAELTRLFALPGNSLLLQLRSLHASSLVTLTPKAGIGARLCVADAFCCGAGRPPQVPETAACILVLWARVDRHSAFLVDYAPDVQRFSLIANGRLVRSGAPLRPDAAPLRLTLADS